MAKITNNDPIPEFPTFAPLESFGTVVEEYDATLTNPESFFLIAKESPNILKFRVNPDFGGSISDIDAIFVTIPGYFPDDFEQQVYQGQAEAAHLSASIILSIDLGVPVEDVIKPGAIILARIRWAITIS